MPTCVPFGAFPPRRAAADKLSRATSARAAALLGYVRDSQWETEDRRPICHNLVWLIENKSLPKGVFKVAQECRGLNGCCPR